MTDPRVGRVSSGDWVLGLEPGAAWLAVQVASVWDSIPLQVRPVPVEVATPPAVEVPVGSSLIAPVALLDRRGDLIPGGDFLFSSLTPDIVQVDQETGQMTGRTEGRGEVAVSTEDFALSDTIIVIVIATTAARASLPDLPDRTALAALVEQCFVGIGDLGEADLREHFGGGDETILTSLVLRAGRGLRLDRLDRLDPAVRSTDTHMYAMAYVRLSWDTGFGRPDSAEYRILANATWNGGVWQLTGCPIWLN